jgi:hypothetical protein
MHAQETSEDGFVLIDASFPTLDSLACDSPKGRANPGVSKRNSPKRSSPKRTPKQVLDFLSPCDDDLPALDLEPLRGMLECVFDPEDALPRKKRCWRLNVSRRQAIEKVARDVDVPVSVADLWIKEIEVVRNRLDMNWTWFEDEMEQGTYDSVLLAVEECVEIERRRQVLLQALDKLSSTKECKRAQEPMKSSPVMKAVSCKSSPKSSPSACSTRPKTSPSFSPQSRTTKPSSASSSPKLPFAIKLLVKLPHLEWLFCDAKGEEWRTAVLARRTVLEFLGPGLEAAGLGVTSTDMHYAVFTNEDEGFWRECGNETVKVFSSFRHARWQQHVRMLNVKPKVLLSKELAGGCCDIDFAYSSQGVGTAIFLRDGQTARWFDIFGLQTTVEQELKTRMDFTFRHSIGSAEVVASWPPAWTCGRVSNDMRRFTFACAPSQSGVSSLQILGRDFETDNVTRTGVRGEACTSGAWFGQHLLTASSNRVQLRNDAGEVIREAKLDGEARVSDVEWPQCVVATSKSLYLVNANLKVLESYQQNFTGGFVIQDVVVAVKGKRLQVAASQTLLAANAVEAQPVYSGGSVRVGLAARVESKILLWRKNGVHMDHAASICLRGGPPRKWTMTEYYLIVSEASDRTSLFLWPTTDEAAESAAQQEYGREALHCVVRGVGGDWEPERPMQGIALRSWGCKKDVTTFTVSRSGRIIATVDGVGTLNVFEWPTTISPRMQAVRDRIKDLENAEIAAAQEAARQAAEAADLSNTAPDEVALQLAWRLAVQLAGQPYFFF